MLPCFHLIWIKQYVASIPNLSGRPKESKSEVTEEYSYRKV